MRMKTQHAKISGTYLKQSKGKFVAINTHMRSKERSNFDTFSSKVKELQEQDQKTQKLAEDKT